MQRFTEAVELLCRQWRGDRRGLCPNFRYALGRTLILPSEASSNLAKFDGMRTACGVGDDGDSGVEQVMSATRAAGFGDEVKRRIMLGTYALSLRLLRRLLRAGTEGTDAGPARLRRRLHRL